MEPPLAYVVSGKRRQSRGKSGYVVMGRIEGFAFTSPTRALSGNCGVAARPAQSTVSDLSDRFAAASMALALPLSTIAVLLRPIASSVVFQPFSIYMVQYRKS